MNSNDSYTPDEIRLLDEFAGQCLRESWDQWENGEQDKVARYCYETAAAMIAERRKRVPSIDTTVRDLVRDLCAAGEKEFATAPVAQPEPEKGELTEEAVADWRAEASDTPIKDAPVGVFRIGDDEIDRAVALMREGLAAKQERDEARAELAAVQPVLDAVVSHFKFPYAKWEIDPFKTLQAYADRRRAEKGAS